jgi:soluble lytic murein transglycosylase-like protein
MLILLLLSSSLWLNAAAAASPWAGDLQAGDCTAVLSKLPAPATDVQRFVVGRCLLRTQRAIEAAVVLQAVQGTLASHAKAELSRAQLDAGDSAAALATLAGVDLPGDAEVILRARALLFDGSAFDPVRAAQTLGAVPANASDERLYWTGEALSGAASVSNDLKSIAALNDQAVAVFRTLWTQYPTSSYAERGALRLAALGQPAPDFSAPAGRELALARAKRLLAVQQAPMAIPLLDGINAAVPFVDSQLMFMAEALFDAKIYVRAAEWYTRAGADAAGPRAAFHQALAVARSGDYPGAAAKYTALIARFPTSTEADEASWKPGYMEYDAGHLPQAVEMFAAYINSHPSGKFLWDARWLRAWSLYRLGRSDEALVAFDKVIAGPNADLVAAARYWKARATKSDDALREVLAKHPDTSYAYFAAARLGKTWPALATAEPPAFPDTFLSSHPVTRDARALADAGLGELASVPAADIEAAAASESTALAMAGLLLDLDRIIAAQRLARPYATTPAGRALSAPRPYRAVVDGIAAATGLPALLPYAIMNAESGLDPSVTSPAGARGLMQLMPLLATDLAKERVAGFEVDDLYRAGVNTRLGTTELSLLHGRFASSPLPAGGPLPLVIAAYNGGSDAVSRWLAADAAAPGLPDADRYSEDISFTETRRYVRRVLGYYQRYRRIYGG